jgi:hypothetical protein
MAKFDSEEVDLLDLLASFLAALKRNLIFTIGLPLIGVLIALAVSYKSRDLFESALLIETSLLSENECKFIFNQLNKVGTIPGLSGAERNQVAWFRFDMLKGPTAAQITTDLKEESLFMEVTARVYNQEVFPSLEKAVVRIINENPSVVRHRIERERFYSEMIAKIEREIASMEEVKAVPGNKVADYINPAELYAGSVKLYKEKILFEIRRDQIKSVQLIKGFDSLTIDAKQSKVVVAIIGFSIGFACLCLFLFMQFFIRYFTVYETTH